MYDRNRFDAFWHLIETIDPELLTVVKAPEIWSIADVVDHMVDAEMQSYVRIRSALYDQAPIIPNHDENAWQASSRPHYAHAQARQLINSVRQANTDLLASLSNDEQERIGMHTTAGAVKVREFYLIYDAHVDVHLQQVKRLLANLVAG